MPDVPTRSASSRCRCGARRVKDAKKCRKCEARSRYRRKTHYQKLARRRARQFQQDRHERKGILS
jgi:ribosomal protein L40E